MGGDWKMWLSEMRSGMAYTGDPGGRVLALATALEAVAGMVPLERIVGANSTNPYSSVRVTIEEETSEQRDARISQVIAKAIGVEK
jgi:hypothetical protein